MSWQKGGIKLLYCIYCKINPVLYIVVWCNEFDCQIYEQLNVSQIWQTYFEGEKKHIRVNFARQLK